MKLIRSRGWWIKRAGREKGYTVEAGTETKSRYPRWGPERELNPPLQLSGIDGNAHNIIAQAMKAAKVAGWSPEEREEIRRWCMNDAESYDHIIQSMMHNFEVA